MTELNHDTVEAYLRDYYDRCEDAEFLALETRAGMTDDIPTIFATVTMRYPNCAPERHQWDCWLERDSQGRAYVYGEF